MVIALVLLSIRRRIFYEHYIVCLIVGEKVFILNVELKKDINAKCPIYAEIIYNGWRFTIQRTCNIKDLDLQNAYSTEVVDLITYNQDEFIPALKRFMDIWYGKKTMHYSLVDNNCESISRQIFYGKKLSLQTEILKKQIIDLLQKDVPTISDTLKCILNCLVEYRMTKTYLEGLPRASRVI